MFGSARKKGILSFVTYILLVNFINLTANFYQVSSLDHTLLKYEDPYDSLSELVLEYFLDMDNDTIPDTELPEDKRKILDIKTLIGNETFQFERHFANIIIINNIFATDMYKNIVFEKLSPPPKS
jgi:hypothetical protein